MSSWVWALCAISGWMGCGYFFVAHRRDSSATFTVTSDVDALESVEPTRNESQLVLDALGLGIVVVDELSREVYRNKAAEDITGARHADVLVDAVVERLMVTASRGRAVTEQIQLAGPPSRVLVVAAQPLEGGGAMATINDITQQWRIDQVRTDFVANVSHELKTPIGALSILAETIEGETQDELILRLVQRMVLETQRMAVTIDDLLELSSIEMGEQMLVAEVDLNDVVAEVIERTTPAATHKGVALHLVGTSEKVLISGNFSQLVSAVGNLVGNAIKYSDEGQMVTVALRTTDDVVEISVEDKGIGIPMASLDRIFERFYRVDRARSRGTGGTGLGLSIVRHVATNHGGEVNVRSREGEGSTFCLVLPRQEQAKQGTMNTNGEREDNDK